jgi:histidine ammonia-lyase
MMNSKRSINKITLNGLNLTVDAIEEIMNQYFFKTTKSGKRNISSIKFEIDSLSIKRMLASRKYVEEISKDKVATYGINTGFGALSNKRIPNNQLNQLQYNLIRSHCTGVGSYYSNEIVFLIMLIRANCLVQGFSGVNPYAVELILTLLNLRIFPQIPQKGSVGASGDLAPLSHMALALIGEGEVQYEGKVYDTNIIFKKFKIKPLQLGAKDGLALINGTSVMTALGVHALIETKKLINWASISSALSLEAMKGSLKPFDKDLNDLKPHSGQVKIASDMRNLLKDSEIQNSHNNCEKVQDPYSLRCIPQVHGSILVVYEHVKSVMNIELNSVTDNPLVFPKEKKIISGGNFHGEMLALSMDYLSLALSEISNICERRIDKLMNPEFSGLPAFLTKNSGINSGLMIAHVTAASLASENKLYAQPASIDSIPTSTDKEDHVSMGVTSGLKLLPLIENIKYCLSIEILAATQGIEFLRPLKTSKILESVIRDIRKIVPKIEEDRVFKIDIDNIFQLINEKNPKCYI